jgi:hypothetical protein
MRSIRRIVSGKGFLGRDMMYRVRVSQMLVYNTRNCDDDRRRGFTLTQHEEVILQLVERDLNDSGAVRT